MRKDNEYNLETKFNLVCLLGLNVDVYEMVGL